MYRIQVPHQMLQLLFKHFNQPFRKLVYSVISWSIWTGEKSFKGTGFLFSNCCSNCSRKTKTVDNWIVKQGVLLCSLCLSTSFVSSSLWRYLHSSWFQYLTHPQLKPFHNEKMASLTLSQTQLDVIKWNI